MSDSPPTALAVAKEPGQSSASPAKTIEAWAKSKKLTTFAFACAKAHAGWPNGQSVTEREFDQAVKAASEVEFR